MSHHARPHLETHNRAQGHSAVAGAAYRLGLRLYDEHSKKWCDFRRRALGEEIVRAITVAPEGAPPWATDPAQLWNRVEHAEKRKDSQVARDYRIPIPLGLSDQQAGDLAEAMARFIAQELNTAVSMGLHRDADVDALGNTKTPDKQGFHAHLYFPTRKIEEIEGEDGSSSWGLGAKLTILSNKRTSALVIEKFNEKWAEVCNRFAMDSGLAPDFDHRSYARLGLPDVPQPTLGRAATAMERRGIPTNKGDVLRAASVIRQEAMQAVKALVQDMQQIEKAAAAVEPIAPPSPVDVPAPTVIAVPQKVATFAIRARTDGNVGLFARFSVALAEEEPSPRVARIVRVIERTVGLLLELAQRWIGHRRERSEKVSEGLEAAFQLDRARERRERSRRKAQRWEIEHPWQVRMAALLSGGNKPAALQTLLGEARDHNGQVQQRKLSLHSHQVYLDALDGAGAVLERRRAAAQAALKQSLDALAEAEPSAVKTLLAAATKEEGMLLREVLPEEDVMLDPGPVPGPVLELSMGRQHRAPRM
jgi:hypothetical protein